MCGIAGLYNFETLTENREETRELVTDLLLDIETRGIDATGISFVDTHENKITTFKKPVRARDFINETEFKDLFLTLKNYNLILLHTRAVTHGNKSNPLNNHPHHDIKNNNVMIHNGIIRNYDELKKIKGLELAGECDSEIILSLYNFFKNSANSEKKKKKAIFKTLKKLAGSMGIALYDAGKLYLFSDVSPLITCYNRTRKLFLFSSHEEIFNKLFSSAITEYNIYDFETESEDYAIRELDNNELVTVNFETQDITLKDAETGYVSYTPAATNTVSSISDDDYYIPARTNTAQDRTRLIPLKEITESDLTPQERAELELIRDSDEYKELDRYWYELARENDAENREYYHRNKKTGIEGKTTIYNLRGI